MVCIQGASRKIGENDGIVDIDESKFVKRKYHKGKPKVCEDWVLGGVCRETGQCFMVIVPNRTRETLQKYIKRYVNEGSVIITDCWAAYNDLSAMVNDDDERLRPLHS